MGSPLGYVVAKKKNKKKMDFKKNKKSNGYYEYVLVYGHPYATKEDVEQGIATYEGEISPIAKVKKQRTTKWIRWKDAGVWRFALRESVNEKIEIKKLN